MKTDNKDVIKIYECLLNLNDSGELIERDEIFILQRLRELKGLQ